VHENHGNYEVEGRRWPKFVEVVIQSVSTLGPYFGFLLWVPTLGSSLWGSYSGFLLWVISDTDCVQSAGFRFEAARRERDR
jgi:hypothetical protein